VVAIRADAADGADAHFAVVILRVPARPSRLNDIQCPVRRNVCARRRRLAKGAGIFWPVRAPSLGATLRERSTRPDEDAPPHVQPHIIAGPIKKMHATDYRARTTATKAQQAESISEPSGGSLTRHWRLGPGPSIADRHHYHQCTDRRSDRVEAISAATFISQSIAPGVVSQSKPHSST